MRDAAPDAGAGAYAFLGLVKGHENFVQYIPSAVRSLQDTVAKIDKLEPLACFLANL
jgi:hypothetical protein